jgi:hypothetical protein
MTWKLRTNNGYTWSEIKNPISLGRVSGHILKSAIEKVNGENYFKTCVVYRDLEAFDKYHTYFFEIITRDDNDNLISSYPYIGIALDDNSVFLCTSGGYEYEKLAPEISNIPIVRSV